MVALKQKLLGEGGLLTPGHSVLELDALADTGANSLRALARTLDPQVGTAIVTEGLMNYLDPDAARGVWQRIAAALRRFPQGVYLNDLYLRPQHLNVAAGVFGAILQAFVRGRMHVHFRTEEEVVETMENCGFSNTSLHHTRDLPETREYAGIRGGDAVMVLEARI
jgi:O-methyltransferase involved in polyketide biosynthesis